MQELTPHPAAAIFPMLGEEELTDLQNDISVDGQHHPIITWNGMIVDGRNRYLACRRIGKKPKTKNIDFKDESEVIAYIVSTNIKRRHLTSSQRMAIAAELANLEQGRPREEKGQICPSSKTTVADAARQMQVSERGTKQAKAVLKASPELHEKVKAGELSVNAAHAQVKPKKEKPAPPPEPALPEIDPDCAHMDDPPPYIPPAAKPNLYIGPAEGEDVEAWRETQAEPEQQAPSQRAQDILAEVLTLCEFDRNWIINSLTNKEANL